MTRSRITATAAGVLISACLVAASAAAEPDQRQGTSAQATLTQANVDLIAGTDHGPVREEYVTILDDQTYTETFRSRSSGSHGTESSKAFQDTSLSVNDDGVDPVLMQFNSNGSFTASADASKPPNGYADAYADGALAIEVHSDNFLTMEVEGTLFTSNSSSGGCADAELLISDELGGFEQFVVNAGPDCGDNFPKSIAVVDEFQLPSGTSSISLRAGVEANSPCDATSCEPATTGTARWDFTMSFCSNSYSEGDDLILGTTGPDVLCGGAGADEISGSDGDDLIIAGAGHDILTGGLGADIIDAEGGNDELWGDSEENCTRLDDGGDILDPGPGDDEMHGCGGDDFFLEGSSLGALVYGGPGNDVIAGGPGPDLIWGGGAGDLIGGNGGDDKLYGEGGKDELYGNAGADRLDGGAGTLDFCRGGGQSGDRRFNCER